MADKHIKLSKFELELMEILWKSGSGSVRELQEQLPKQHRPAYTTVQTIINRLEDKGAVRRVKKISNAFIYQPVITRKALLHRLLDDLLNLFGGSARPLMAHLIEENKVSLADVREMESMLETLAARKAQKEKASVKQQQKERKADKK